ncbi:Cysteine-rich repeat secretory protein 55 [Linum grandiflorum]
MAPSTVLLAISGVVTIMILIGLDQCKHAMSIQGIALNCNNFNYPSHDARRVLVGDLLQELVEQFPYWSFRLLRTSIPRDRPLIYGYANCTDGPSSDCVQCLNMAKRSLLQNCPHRIGAEVFYDICYMRYEAYLF